jgi:hypothetical protein
VVLWSDLHKQKGEKLAKAQALVRGWLLRRRLLMHGPGVLARSLPTNEEDLLTYDSIKTIHPFAYFAFEQNGKVWGFAFDTLWKWCLRSEQPTNPYTKLPIDYAILKRLHAVWSYRFRYQMPLPEESATYEDRLMGRIHIISQILATYGFGSISPMIFRRLNKLQYLTLFRFLFDDIQVVLSEGNANRRMALGYCLRASHVVHNMQSDYYILQATYSLMLMLLRPKDPYILAFAILSSLYRC